MTGLLFVESPRWHDARLWFSDWGTQEVIAVDLEGKSEVIVRVPTVVERDCPVAGGPFCIDWLPDGRLLIVSGRDRLLLRREPDGLPARIQDRLSRLLRVDPGTLSRWERGLRVPTGKYARLAEVFYTLERELGRGGMATVYPAHDHKHARLVARDQRPRRGAPDPDWMSVGTPAYMSPQQAAGGSELDGRSDSYSLGCALYEMPARNFWRSALSPRLVRANRRSVAHHPHQLAVTGSNTCRSPGPVKFPVGPDQATA